MVEIGAYHREVLICAVHRGIGADDDFQGSRRPKASPALASLLPDTCHVKIRNGSLSWSGVCGQYVRVEYWFTCFCYINALTLSLWRLVALGVDIQRPKVAPTSNRHTNIAASSTSPIRRPTRASSNGFSNGSWSSTYAVIYPYGPMKSRYTVANFMLSPACFRCRAIGH